MGHYKKLLGSLRAISFNGYETWPLPTFLQYEGNNILLKQVQNMAAYGSRKKGVLFNFSAKHFPLSHQELFSHSTLVKVQCVMEEDNIW
jgi:hypothetical protein